MSGSLIVLATQQRTCCICRGKALKGDLARLVVLDGEITYDAASRLPGRGAYVHRRLDCILNINRPEKWRRALRIESNFRGFSSLVAVGDKLLKEIG